MVDKHNITSNSNIMDGVKWWEKKRLYYNLALITIIIIGLILKLSVPNSFLSENYLLAVLIWMFGANILFCSGWGFEVLLMYFFKISLKNNMRFLFFSGGLVISIVWTWIALLPQL